MFNYSLVLENVPLKNSPTLDLKISTPSTEPIKLLTLHGGPGMDTSYFLPFLAPLQREASLLFYTQGSSGASTMAGLLNELHSILQHFKNDQVIIFAHSFGAALVFEYVRTYGDHLITALILSSWMYDVQCVARYLARFPSEGSDESYKTDADYKAQTLRITDRYFTSPFVNKGKKIIEKIRYNAALSNAIWKTFLADFDGREVVRHFTKPMLSISGSDDLLTDREYLRNGEALNRRIEVVEIGNVGHFPFVEKPEDVNRAIQRFINLFSKKIGK